MTHFYPCPICRQYNTFYQKMETTDIENSIIVNHNDQTITCCICNDNLPNVKLNICSHICTCEECTIKLRKANFVQPNTVSNLPNFENIDVDETCRHRYIFSVCGVLTLFVTMILTVTLTDSKKNGEKIAAYFGIVFILLFSIIVILLQTRLCCFRNRT
jgi:hypothetical protein